MGLMEAVIFAFFSFAAFVCAIITIMERKYKFVVMLGICTSFSSMISAYAFRLALIDSGKNPALLGYYRYPFVLPIYCIFIALGIVLIFYGVIQQKRTRKTKIK